jgi:hypothetical protein
MASADSNINLGIKKPPLKIDKKINISDAVIVESKPVDKKTDNEDIDSEYVKNLQDQKTVDLSESGKKQAGEKVTIDFMNQDHISSFTAGETKKADENIGNSNSQFKDKSVEDLKAEIKKAEEDSTKNFTAKDFEDIARFMIFLIDTGLSSGLKWWSKDTSEAAYSLPEKKKEMLVYQLTLILTKYQAKFSIEFMFFLTIVIVYAPAFVKAKNNRKVNLNDVEAKLNSEESQVFENAESVVTDKDKGQSKPVTPRNKRKPGNPGKA